MDGVTHYYGNDTTTATSIANTKATTFKNLHSTSGATVTFEAIWDANTGTQYTVYHYVKRVWQNTYALTEVETWYGTTDSELILSWLAKESEFVCAHYDKWSLTWTESWPWPVVTETTIRWDGTTKIYLYYVRNYYRVTLSGDEHVESLTWDGVRECGSERPIDATPKPWYHFVRWDREERSRREGEDDESDPMHSGWEN